MKALREQEPDSYSILPKNSAEDGIGSICTTCPDHISWVYVFDICWDTNLLEMPFYLYENIVSLLPQNNLIKGHVCNKQI